MKIIDQRCCSPSGYALYLFAMLWSALLADCLLSHVCNVFTWICRHVSGFIAFVIEPVIIIIAASFGQTSLLMIIDLIWTVIISFMLNKWSFTCCNSVFLESHELAVFSRLVHVFIVHTSILLLMALIFILVLDLVNRIL